MDDEEEEEGEGKKDSKEYQLKEQFQSKKEKCRSSEGSRSTNEEQ